MKKLINISSIAMLALFGACTSELPVQIEDNNEAAETKVCRMTFEAIKPSFDGTTRANGDEWENGDCIYLLFTKDDDTKVAGKATYDANDKYWNLEYSGDLSATADSKCWAYYFEDGVTEGTEYVFFSATTGIYVGSGKYTKSASGVNVSATLSPYQSRIRFTGTAGKSFTVAGPYVYVSFKKESATFYYDTSVESSIKSDGSSPYLYMTLYGTDRVMSVSYDNLSFSMTCESPVLDDGKSGYMKLPTKESHSGWTMTETTAPSVGETTISNIEANTADFSASLISDGNAAVTDCGFVYALTQNPTLENTAVKCSASSFMASVSDLTKNTTYYVRAYATNAAGTSYGTETSFTTTAGAIAVKSGLTAYYMFEDDYEDASGNEMGGFGVGSPKFVSGVETGGKAITLSGKNYMKVGTAIHDYTTHSVSFWIKDPGEGSIFATYSTKKKYNGPIMSLEVEGGMLRYVITGYLNHHTSYRKDTGKFTHPSLNDDKWHHIVLVSDRDASTYNYWTTILYVDGKKVDVQTEYDYDTDAGTAFQLGGDVDHYTSVYEGATFTVDNFRTYKRCISADEVKEIYNSEKQ